MQRTIDPTPSTVRVDHRLEGLRGVSGVTYDGRHVWLVDRRASTLLAVDPGTGVVARRLGGLVVTSGLTWDGTHLWGLAHESLLEIDPESGEVLSSVTVPDGGSGLAWAAGSVWMGRFEGREVVRLDPRTGEVLKTIATERFVTGVTWHAGELWFGAWESADEESPQTAELRRVDPESGETTERLACAPGLLASGIEAVGPGSFWVGDSVQGRVCSVERGAGGPR